MNPVFNKGQKRWEGLPTQTTVKEGITVLVLDNGHKILTFGDTHQAGAQVHVLDPEGREVAMWDCAEWETEGEGESVMGAMLRAAGGTRSGPVAHPQTRSG